EVGAAVERVGEAVEAHGAAMAHGTGLPLRGALDEERVGRLLALTARRERGPVTLVLLCPQPCHVTLRVSLPACRRRDRIGTRHVLTRPRTGLFRRTAP